MTNEMSGFIYDYILKSSRFVTILVIVCILVTPIWIGSSMDDIVPLHLGWRIAIGYVFFGICYAVISWNNKRHSKESSSDDQDGSSSEYEVFIKENHIKWEQHGTTGAIQYDARSEVHRRENLALIFGTPSTYVCIDLDQLNAQEREYLEQALKTSR